MLAQREPPFGGRAGPVSASGTPGDREMPEPSTGTPNMNAPYGRQARQRAHILTPSERAIIEASCRRCDADDTIEVLKWMGTTAARIECRICRERWKRIVPST
jgi:hypothetical protein